MNDDTISRQAAIDAINKAFERVFAWDGTSPLGDKVLENVPSAQPEQRWVPVTERLPEDVELGVKYPTVIFCTEDATYTGYYEYHIGGLWLDKDGDNIIHGVIAWMPLPKSYKEGEL